MGRIRNKDTSEDSIFFISLLLCQLVNRHGCKTIKNGGPERGGIHNPANRRSSDEWNRQRYKDNQKSCKAIKNGGPEGGGIHDPANRRSSDEWNGQRYKDYQKNRLSGYLHVVKFFKPLWQNIILSHGVAQVADSAQHTEEAGKHKRQQRCHQDINACIAEVIVSRVECWQSGNSFISVQMSDVINPTGAPFRIGGYAQ